MRGAGSSCVLRAYWWDDPPPVEGDFLRTRSGSCYRIEQVRPSDYEHIAWVLTVTRLGKNAVQFGDEGVREWVFAPRLKVTYTPGTLLPSSAYPRGGRDDRCD